MIKKKLKAIVLGGTSAHIELIEELKRRGYYTILIDYYKKPIAKEYADEHIQESTLDKEKVLQIAKDKKINLIITTSVDQANLTAVYVGEKLGLYVPYSYETALNVTDKVLMKKIMIDNDIPTSKYIIVENTKECENHKLQYPVIVKPSDSNGSKGVHKAENINELKLYTEQALNISRNKKAIIEEYKKGIEVGADCFITNNRVHILTKRLRKKFTTKDSLQQIIGTVTPINISEELYIKLDNILKKITKVFKLNNTPLIVQMIINNDEISVIELAPRIGGGESGRMIKYITDFDIISGSVDSFLGNPTYVDYKKVESYYSETLLYVKPSIFGRIEGYNQLLNSGVIEYFVQYKDKGVKIGNDLSSINRVGAFLVKGKNIKEVNDNIKLAIQGLEVYSISENPIMRKDIY